MRDRHIVDTRIHCCLYFIRPSGHSLKPIDIIVMKKLADVVNVVPVIAKADSLTLEERNKFKQTIRSEMAYHNIRSYPLEGGDYDQDESQLNEALSVSDPITWLLLLPVSCPFKYAESCYFLTGLDSLCSSRKRKKRHCRWQASAGPQEPLGSDQRGERAALRLQLSA